MRPAINTVASISCATAAVLAAAGILASASYAAGVSLEGLLATEHPHPRAHGAFPRILHKYVRYEHALTLSDASRHDS